MRHCRGKTVPRPKKSSLMATSRVSRRLWESSSLTVLLEELELPELARQWRTATGPNLVLVRKLKEEHE